MTSELTTLHLTMSGGSSDVFEECTLPLNPCKLFFLLDCMDGMWVGEGEGHYTQSNEGICVNVLLLKRYILPLPPLGLYSGPSMRLVISFSRPNCLSFCLLFIRGIQSLLLEWIFASGIRSITCWSWHFNASFVGVMHRIMYSNEVISVCLPLKGNPRCPLDSWYMFWVNYQHKD